MNQSTKSRVIAGAVLVLVLLAGVAIGFFLHHAVLRRPGFPGLALGGGPGGPPPPMKGWMLQRLDRDLKLSPDQHERIDSVLTRSESDLRTLMGETRPRFEAISARTRTAIQSVLTPAQQEEFARITSRLDARRAGRAHR